MPLAYGARFLHELRRLTNSTWGWTYQQLQAIEQADEPSMLRLLRDRGPA